MPEPLIFMLFALHLWMVWFFSGKMGTAFKNKDRYGIFVIGLILFCNGMLLGSYGSQAIHIIKKFL